MQPVLQSVILTHPVVCFSRRSFQVTTCVVTKHLSLDRPRPLLVLDVVISSLSTNTTGVADARKNTILDLDLALASSSDSLHFLPLSYFRRKDVVLIPC